MITQLVKLMDHPAFRVPPPPTHEEVPDVQERRDRLWQRRQEIESLVFRREGNEDHHFHWIITLATRILKLFLVVTGLWARGRRNAHALHLREVTWQPPRLPPALDGMRLLHVADLHYRRKDPQFVQAVRELLTDVEADLCLMTGDYRFGHLGPSDHVTDNLAELMGVMKIHAGCFAILGNHDNTALVGPFPDFGITLLYNEGRVVTLRDTPIWVAGTEDSHIMNSSDLRAALHERPEGMFTILLAHTPEDIHEAAAMGCDIYLCGHTHGGQIRLPGLGAVVSNARCAREHKHGEWRVGEMLGNTSAGLGTTDLPVRFNCPAEAHLITLRRG